jgi:hypothetical protein
VLPKKAYFEQVFNDIDLEAQNSVSADSINSSIISLGSNPGTSELFQWFLCFHSRSRTIEDHLPRQH